MILCDTNILIEFYKGNAAIIQTLRGLGQAHLTISAITQAELLIGARDKRELDKINQHLALCHCHPLTPEISVCFINLMARHALSHRPAIPDLLIAATAITQGIPLYTLNTKDFKYLPGLNLYTPQNPL